MLITVTDNGIGIQLKDIDRIFELNLPPERNGSRLRNYKNIIENYKGTITFETEFGKELLLFRFQ
jgi:signal transduction histidine kinase